MFFRSRTAFLAFVLIVPGCASSSNTADSYAGSWIGHWSSSSSPGAGGNVEADLKGAAGRLEGSVAFISALGHYNLPVSQVLPTRGRVKVSGMATATNGSSTVKIETILECKGKTIEGHYSFPVLQDEGTFTLEKEDSR